MPDPDVETFLEYSGAYMDINSLDRDYEATFIRDMSRPSPAHTRFRRGFAKAVLGQVTALQYERAAGWDFDDDQEFREHLAGLWRRFYGDADPHELAGLG
ncbi:hypothetical protein KIH74_23210 [Kineosporia sp. J2-2]|uniref:Uncharacterized protein n=1 Tax=Kineosporia corallincola TaxID=2835133 RepID=A0ABS5TL83_9ACTN|nr:hypothetical protein [Kineosporia corallincola]MBT0771870.1 hypothetical protein [Kineosporia corallincola]